MLPISVMFVPPNRAEHRLFRSITAWGFGNTFGQDSHHQRLSLGGWWTFTCPCPTDVGYGTHAWCTGDIDHKRAFSKDFFKKKGEKRGREVQVVDVSVCVCVGGCFSLFLKCKCV